MKTNLHQQQGIGLIEVMIALGILLLTSLAAGTIQTTGMVSAHASSVHFSLDHLGSEMIEMLRAQSTDATAGSFDFDGSSESSATAPEDSDSPQGLVYAWNKRVGLSIPTGEGSVSCVAGICSISISWIEEIDGSDARQFFRTQTPL